MLKAISNSGSSGGGGGGSGTVTSITAGTGLTGGTITTSGTIALESNQTYRQINFSIDGQGSAISGTSTWYQACTPFAGTITAWNLVADVSGSISIDVWKANAAVPTVANTIVGGSYPALSSAQSAFAGSVGSWTTTVSANDVWAFNIRSSSTVTKVSLTIEITAS